ncbi:MAG: hypothetical protein GTN67_13105 [Hydrotalea flava]|uniref:hypothetical protein n=1 Tax=Hydrotalea TaxID=1004300 RepID=UPI0009421722|nr:MULTISPECIES: hypothetical protein [Hydrotalea]MBY0346880.1 hypothetical protein [Hydrotalea flava]NIM36251.1 hypothetical protein [Hydrotalea flava]NIM39102.1 hypothetical protein [Hydrotalea flava]NIN04337.1 hypothetical protein [Hydrotalea flava]NIN15963.1 hypothetical protein [Hydrotalea flava]
MSEQPDNKKLLLQYATLTGELIIAIAISVYSGWWMDVKFSFAIPLLVWLLPLIVIIVLIIKVIKDTSRK